MEKLNWHNLLTSNYESLVVRGKEIYVVEREDGSHFAWCMCWGLGAIFQVPLTRKQAAEIVLPRPRPYNMQEILSELPKELREIFTSGMTPAEFDLRMTGKLRPMKFYESLGYAFLRR